MEFGSYDAPHRILAVDDDPISLALTAVLLEAEGCIVSQAASGEQALVRAQSDPPDCVIADLRMPGLAGPDLAHRLRQAAPAALLFAMSATPPPHVDGYDGVLKKPLSPESLQLALTRRAAPSADAPPVGIRTGVLLDEDVLDTLRRSMSLAGLQEVFTIFFRDTHQRVATMRFSDPEAVRREAHTIKGGAAMLGALQLSLIATAVESGIVDAVDRSGKLDELEACCRSTEVILKERLRA